MGAPGQYLRTLPHLKPWQVLGRILAPIRRSVASLTLPSAPDGLSGRLEPRPTFICHDPWNTRKAILSGQFRFLNQTADLGGAERNRDRSAETDQRFGDRVDVFSGLDWTAVEMPLLWRFNLHYFNYLHLLDPSERIRLCRSWVHANPAANSIAWHPYPTSLRIVNWCKAGIDSSDLMRSLYRQVAFLYRNLETHVYGNHLAENARALVFGGTYFEGFKDADDWKRRGLELLVSESSEQILTDGGHYERSPMYLALMLELWLDAINILPGGSDQEKILQSAARQMADALQTMTHPDGGIALFNDSTCEIAPKSTDLAEYATRLTGHRPRPRAELEETGYFTDRTESIYLIVDGGPGGPDHLMAHAHADVFSFELSISNLRFVVDSGVFEYAPGAMRTYSRSTMAHNTVDIDGTDQFECWASFRVARRSSPKDVRVHTDKQVWTFSGEYDGYRKLIGDGIVHRRQIRSDRDRRLIRIEDEIDGHGVHSAASRVHLHPDVEVTGTDELVLRRGDVTCRIRSDTGPLLMESAWYCPEFGKRRNAPVLVLRHDGRLPARFGYSITY